MPEEWQICIIGGGPAAHTAAIYASRASLSTLVLEGFMANDIAPGGQLTTTTHVENFPGFPDGVMGPELCDRMRKHSINQGARVLSETVLSVEGTSSPFRVVTAERVILAEAIIVATGSIARRLTFPGSNTFWNAGISACAVCDGAAPLFRNRPLAVIGGGDSAMEEATYLTKYASVVYLIHRRDTFRASKAMQKRVLENPKIKILYNSTVVAAHGADTLEKITIDTHGTQSDLDVSGLFFAIGHEPASSFLEGLVAVDDQGYIVTRPGSTCTSVPGIFAAGDVQDKRWRQAITAAASGCMAALEADAFINHHADCHATGSIDLFLPLPLSPPSTPRVSQKN